MKKINLLSVIKLCFIAVCITACVSGIVRAAAVPKDIDYYESRPANQLPSFTMESFADSSFQDDAEDALADQLPLSTYFKKAYNAVKSVYLDNTAWKIKQANSGKYYFMKTVAFINDMAAYLPSKFEDGIQEMIPVLESYNKVMQYSPDTDFYMFYVESEYDISLETGEKIPYTEFIFSSLDMPDSHKGVLEVNSYEDYARNFYVTDHHWNYQGAYEGYKKILKLLGCEDEPLQPLEEVTFSTPWRGSKTSALGYDNKKEIFRAYRFEYPKMDITIEGQPVSDYGRQEEFFANTDATVSSMSFYGENYTEVTLDTHRDDRENLLLIGDSYTHSILKCVASHYNCTYLLDPRYSGITAESINRYIQEHDISKVLFLNYYATLHDGRFVIPEK